MSDPVYQVYTLKDAQHDRHSRENVLVEDPHDGPQPLASYVWMIARRSAVTRNTILVSHF